jgi:hypothetical protein
MALHTSELHRVMKRDPAFLGVFALDQVPPIIKKSANVKLIINLDPARKPGSHWVAIWRKDNIGYYFDSFGRRPPPQLVRWLVQNSDSWIFNSIVMQSPNDKTACGYLCLSFLTNKFCI